MRKSRRFLLNHRPSPTATARRDRSPTSILGVQQKKKKQHRDRSSRPDTGRRKIEWKQATGRSDPRGIDQPRSTSTRTVIENDPRFLATNCVESRGKSVTRKEEGKGVKEREEGRESSTRHSWPVIEARKTKKQAT